MIFFCLADALPSSQSASKSQPSLRQLTKYGNHSLDINPAFLSKNLPYAISPRRAIISLHSHGSRSESSDHQYSGTVLSSSENPGMSFLNNGKNPISLIQSIASSTVCRHSGSSQATPYIIHVPFSFGISYPPEIKLLVNINSICSYSIQLTGSE